MSSRTWSVVMIAALLAACRSDSTGPKRSCTGPRLLFTRGTTAGVEIAVANVGGNIAPLVSPATPPAAAAWSPDGCHIAYTSGVRLFVANADGSNASPIHSASLNLDYPAWSPDGSELLVTEGNMGFGMRVWRVRADGSAARPLTNDTLATSMAGWSSDGTLIAYLRIQSKMTTWPYHLVIMNANGTGAHEVASSVNERAAWVPDTHRIAYGDASDPLHGFALRTVAADGSDDRLLLGGFDMRVFDLAWLPDGDSLSFSKIEPDGRWNLNIVSAAGTGLRTITEGFRASWR